METICELYGDQFRRAPSNIFGGDLRTLARRIPVDHELHDIRVLAFEHTALPYCLSFCDKDAKESILDNLNSSNMRVFSLSLGHALTPMYQELDGDRRHLAYCPDCVAHERKQLGFGYWHVSHQLPMVALCAYHGCPLIQGCRNCGPFVGSAYAIAMPGAEACTCKDFVPHLRQGLGSVELDSWLAAESLSSLQVKWDDKAPTLRSKLRRYFISNGLRRKSGIDSTAVFNRVQQVFPEKALKMLGCYSEGNQSQWIKILSKCPRTCPVPTRVFVLMRVFPDLRDFCPEEDVGNDKDAWKIGLDDALTQHKTLKATAKHLNVSWHVVKAELHNRGWMPPQRHRSCIGPAQRSRILESLWAGMTIVEIVALTGCAFQTVKQILASDPDLYRAYPELRRTAVFKKKFAEYEAKAQRIVAESSGKLRCEIVAAHRHVFGWLRQNDPAAYDRILPTALPTRSPATRTARRDWPTLDQVWSQKVRDINQQFLASSAMPEWISRNRLLELAKIPPKSRTNESVLPLTIAALKEVVETRDAFHARRITWAVNEMSKESLIFRWREFYGRVGLDHRLFRRRRDFILSVVEKFGMTTLDVAAR